MRKMFNDVREKKGQSLLEFALVIPLLCILIMGIFDFGWLLHRQITIDHATRAGARRGAVGVQTPAIIQDVRDAVYFPLTDDQISVYVLDTNHNDIGDVNNRTPDNYIVVEVSLIDVPLLTPLRNLISTIGQIDLNSRAEFLIE